VVILVFVPFYATLRLYTAYEYLEKRFDLRGRTVAGGGGVSGVLAGRTGLGAVLQYLEGISNLIVDDGILEIQINAGGRRVFTERKGLEQLGMCGWIRTVSSPRSSALRLDGAGDFRRHLESRLPLRH
jgi:hypothetical protein